MKFKSKNYLKKTPFVSLYLVLLSVQSITAFAYGNDDQSDILENGNIAEFFDLCSGFFAAFLFGISLLAYRNTKSKQILFVTIAFGLFAIRTIISRLDLFIPEIESSILELLLSILAFIALALFFFAIVTKQKINKMSQLEPR